jgi:hypothetical protein
LDVDHPRPGAAMWVWKPIFSQLRLEMTYSLGEHLTYGLARDLDQRTQAAPRFMAHRNSEEIIYYL